MNRTEIMEKLTQATAQMDDAALEDLANWAETAATIRPTGYDQIRETIVKTRRNWQNIGGNCARVGSRT